MSYTAVIVEDNNTSADIAARQMGVLGFESHIAETAEQGYNLVQDIQPQLIVVDERLPDNSGIELIRTLRAQMPHLTVVMSTIVNDEDIIQEAFSAGCNYYAVKPNGLRKLCANYSSADKLLNTQIQELFT